MHPSASPEAEREVKAALDGMSDITVMLRDAGYHLSLYRTNDVGSVLRSAGPGLNNGATKPIRMSSEGLAIGDIKRAIVTEFSRLKSGGLRKSNRLAAVVRHEVGHQFHSCFENFDRHPLIVRLHREDVDDLGDRADGLKYYAQRNKKGPKETIADSFAQLQGGGLKSGFDQDFPRVFTATRMLLAMPIPEIRKLSYAAVMEQSGVQEVSERPSSDGPNRASIAQWRQIHQVDTPTKTHGPIVP